eukprot:365200_1
MLAFAAILTLYYYQCVVGLFPTQCHMTAAYPPPKERQLMEFVIDLDANATTRWNEPILHFKDDIIKTVTLIANELSMLTKYIDGHVDEYLDAFPNDYGDEIRGIANTLNM